DWTSAERLRYTLDCAAVLAALLPGGVDGSISTVPLGFKGFPQPAGHLRHCLGNLVQAAIAFDRLQQETGRLIRLAIEPEPFCLLETTDEVLRFFEQLWQEAAAQNRLEVARRHLGLCYDVCHQAVEFEEIGPSIRSLTSAGVRLNKVHITCALQLDSPAENTEGRQALARYVEERYLHQTMARGKSGNVLRQMDLTQALALEPPADFRDCPAWRIHFHVPVDADQLGPLSTTRPELRQALAAVALLNDAPHLEVETYTWEVLPDHSAEGGANRLIDGLTRELMATRALLQELSPKSGNAD
ncbi:MAG TPA: metabolite traffic protein EboE, partial [Planctomycetaceae bacterium]|nr:metabolite traffic protein EboE [Planctomycetaceae bacterium]